jgi:hypothetical protein
MIEIIESMLSNVWYVFNSLQPLLTFMIGLGTLIAVIYGFNRYNDHSRKLEEINIFKEVREQYKAYEIHIRTEEFVSRYSQNFVELLYAYFDYMGRRHRKDFGGFSSNPAKKIESKEFRDKLTDMLKSLVQLLYFSTKVNQFIKDFNISENDCDRKYYSLFIEDMYRIDWYANQFIEHIEALGDKDKINVNACFDFEIIEFSKGLISNYKKLIDSCEHYRNNTGFAKFDS